MPDKEHAATRGFKAGQSMMKPVTDKIAARRKKKKEDAEKTKKKKGKPKSYTRSRSA